TQNYPEYKKDFNDMLSGLPFMKTKESFIQEIGEENYKLMQKVKKMQSQKGIQALMLFEISIQ
ncbi:MAG: signal peptide peptidase SppA, partial [Flavobacterium sp.]|nr:signal peptide peptidase SppA [Flavobacterium sp.]